MQGRSDSTGTRIECAIRAIVARSDGEDWFVSLDFPRALQRVGEEECRSIINGACDMLADLRRLNRQTRVDGDAMGDWHLIIRCSVSSRRGRDERWQSSVTFSWPVEWSALSRDTREAVFAALLEAFEEAKDSGLAHRMRGWET